MVPLRSSILIEHFDDVVAFEIGERHVADFGVHEPFQCSPALPAGAQFACFAAQVIFAKRPHCVGLRGPSLRAGRLLRFAWVAALRDLMHCVRRQFAGSSEGDPGLQRQLAWQAVKAITHRERLSSGRLDDQVEAGTAGIGYLAAHTAGLQISDRNVGEAFGYELLRGNGPRWGNAGVTKQAVCSCPTLRGQWWKTGRAAMTLGAFLRGRCRRVSAPVCRTFETAS